MKFIGITLIMFGFLAIAGSGGDCDGACMEEANTIGEMLAVIGIGLGLMLVGACFVVKGERNENGL